MLYRRMSKKTKTLQQTLRRLRAFRLPLPTELFTFPLGLALSCVYPPFVAWGSVVACFILCMLLIRALGWLAVNRSVVGQSVLVSLLWGLSLLALPRLCQHPLGVQGLLLVSYLISSLVLLTYRWYTRPKDLNQQCSCIRGKILRAERLRFERILSAFSILALGFILVNLEICPLEWARLRSISSMLIATFAGGIYTLESLHLIWVNKRLQHEVWIPVMNDKQQIIGRVPMTTPRSGQGRLPVVRLITTTEHMVYLEQAERITLPSTSGYDTPFIAWLTEGCQPEQVAQELIDLRFCGIRRAHPRFLLHYHETLDGQPLSVYLFSVEIEDPRLLLIDCLPTKGKWWPIEHVTPRLSERDFAPYLRSELPYLEQTVLLAHRLRSSSQT